jgi:hypothetical protein
MTTALLISDSKGSAPFARPGTDAIITILCDFRQFLAKNWRFFSSKTNVLVKICA